MYLNTNEVRDAFIKFFAKNSHQVVPSSPLIPHNDPSLMFVNAGMVQFKNIFMGLEKPFFTKAVSSQKCIRAGGKHNDLENVGYTTRHHTFFEMLGNFSFGSYFKEEAIFYAWELLTKCFLIPKDKLYVTVYKDDFESEKLWRKIANLEEGRIIKLDDNFWSMGDTGPCGPCSEIFYDHGENISGGLPGTKNQDGDRYVEIWNIVFMEYDQLNKDVRAPLPMKSIDTGMGLERITAVLQNKHDNYDIDLFKNIIAAIEDLTKTKINDQNKFTFRIIADHLRSSAFLIADGVVPSNEEKGYVLRRILRRGMRHLQKLGQKTSSISELLKDLIILTGDPLLTQTKNTIEVVMHNEEIKFHDTLDQSLKILEEKVKDFQIGQTLSGASAFKLYDTYGLPLDFTQEILKEKGLKLDIQGFNQKMQEQKMQGKKSWHGSKESKYEAIWFELQNSYGPTKFLGYDNLDCEGKVIAILQDQKTVNSVNKTNEEFWIITDQTSFYAESGGQKGDIGEMFSKSCKIQVIDTQKFLNLHIHLCLLTSGKVENGMSMHMQVNKEYRSKIKQNHSATHLLHSILRKILGNHITQKGSLVTADKLRFDINHDKPILLDQVEQIEKEINEIILKNLQFTTHTMSKIEAEKKGAMMLFGEKYENQVRVISLESKDGKDIYSYELCGGTHVERSADIGLFKIISQSSIASGIRRIEAVTGTQALSFIQRQNRDLIEAHQKIDLIQKENQKKISDLENNLLKQSFIFTHKTIQKRDILIRYMIFHTLNKSFKDAVNFCTKKFPDSVIVFVCLLDDKSLITGATKANFDATALVKKITNQLQGSAGGSKEFAQGSFKTVADSDIEKIIQNLDV